MDEALNATDVRGWLRDQELLYASRQAYGVRLKMVYRPFESVWEVTLSSNLQYSGNDLHAAIKTFNEIAGL